MVENSRKNYVSPHDEKSRYGSFIEGFEEDNSDASYSKKKLGGRLPKRFVRLSSNYFVKYIEEIKNNPNSSYETYLDNDEIRKGNCPNNFSVLLKINSNDLAEMSSGPNELMNYVKAELCAPAVLNELGVKTVYNSILVETSGYSQYVMSINAVKPDEEFFVLQDFISCNFSEWVESGIDIVRQYATFLLERECGVTPEELKTEKYVKMLNELEDEFIVRYLANVVLLGNNDYNARNYAFAVDKKSKSIRTFPCFDFEFCFNGCYYKPLIEENVEAIYKRNPKVLAEFAKKFEGLMAVQDNGKTKLRNILNQTLQIDIESDFFGFIVSRNIDTFFEAYDKILGDEKMDENQLRIL